MEPIKGNNTKLPVRRPAEWFDDQKPFNSLSSLSNSSNSSGFSFPTTTSSEGSSEGSLNLGRELQALEVASQMIRAKVAAELDDTLDSDDDDAADSKVPFSLEDLGTVVRPEGIIQDAVVEAGSGRVSPRMVDNSQPTPSPFLSRPSSPRAGAISTPVSPREYPRVVQKNIQASLPEGRKSFQPLELNAHTAAYPAQMRTAPPVQEKRFVNEGGFFIRRDPNIDNLPLDKSGAPSDDLQFELSL